MSHCLFAGDSERAGVPHWLAINREHAFRDGHLRSPRSEPGRLQRRRGRRPTRGRSKRRHLHIQRGEADVEETVLAGWNQLEAHSFGSVRRLWWRNFGFRKSWVPAWTLSSSILEDLWMPMQTWTTTPSLTSPWVHMAKWCSFGRSSGSVERLGRFYWKCAMTVLWLYCVLLLGREVWRQSALQLPSNPTRSTF